ncbi:hypothetical protein [Pseudoxanthomonas sp. JBR18]|uniref:hypothetical protein n=1 Tax=Pseudoxanthomonas sp. JBR18 TaxID=2969308 RepID=UPI0023068CF2|nr:hypothetical protein [Pseudoxanthomonas sp. JBR18]WCE03174.1 hypothetical protein PJ250_13745 [Pseudoxanthomonas sp. JBR18]
MSKVEESTAAQALDERYRRQLLLDAHRMAPGMFFSDSDTEEEIRRQLVLAYLGPQPGFDATDDLLIYGAFKAMKARDVWIGPGERQERKIGGRLHLVH